jgi:hypothetical protein
MMGILDTIRNMIKRTEFMYDLSYEWDLAGLSRKEFKVRMNEWQTAFNKGESITEVIDRELAKLDK